MYQKKLAIYVVMSSSGRGAFKLLLALETNLWKSDHMINHYIINYMVYEDNINGIGDDIRTIGRNSVVILNSCKETGLAVHTGKTKRT